MCRHPTPTRGTESGTSGDLGRVCNEALLAWGKVPGIFGVDSFKSTVPLKRIGAPVAYLISHTDHESGVIRRW